MTKRSDSIVRRMAPVSASIWWILRARYSPTQSVPSAQVRPESRPWAGAGMVATTWPERGSTFWIRSSASCHRYSPSKAVPASAATASSRTSAPLPGSSGDDALAAGEPDVRAVEGHAVDVVDAGIGAVLAEDLRLLGFALACRCHDPTTTQPAARPGVTRLSRIRRAPARASGGIDRGRRRAPPPLPRAGATRAGRFAGSSRAHARAPRSTTTRRPRAGRGWRRRVRRSAAPARRRRGASIGDEREAAPGRLDPGERAQGGAQAAELDAEPGAVRLVGGARLEGALDEAIARRRRPARPRRGRRRARTGPGRPASGTVRAGPRTDAPAGVDDEVAGREQGLDLVEADRADHPAADQARRGRRQGAPGPADLGDQGRDAGGDGGGVGAAERGGGVRDPDAAERELGAGELGAGRERRRHAGGVDVDRGERLLGGLELADEELAARGDEAGVERVGAIAERVERLRGGVERAHRPRSGRARRARPPPRRPGSGPGRGARERRSRARRAAGACAPARSRRAGPSRCRAGRAPAGRRAARRA